MHCTCSISMSKVFVLVPHHSRLPTTNIRPASDTKHKPRCDYHKNNHSIKSPHQLQRRHVPMVQEPMLRLLRVVPLGPATGTHSESAEVVSFTSMLTTTYILS